MEMIPAFFKSPGMEEAQKVWTLAQESKDMLSSVMVIFNQSAEYIGVHMGQNASETVPGGWKWDPSSTEEGIRITTATSHDLSSAGRLNPGFHDSIIRSSDSPHFSSLVNSSLIDTMHAAGGDENDKGEEEDELQEENEFRHRKLNLRGKEKRKKPINAMEE